MYHLGSLRVHRTAVVYTFVKWPTAMCEFVLCYVCYVRIGAMPVPQHTIFISRRSKFPTFGAQKTDYVTSVNKSATNVVAVRPLVL